MKKTLSLILVLAAIMSCLCVTASAQAKPPLNGPQTVKTEHTIVCSYCHHVYTYTDSTTTMYYNGNRGDTTYTMGNASCPFCKRYNDWGIAMLPCYEVDGVKVYQPGYSPW